VEFRCGAGRARRGRNGAPAGVSLKDMTDWRALAQARGLIISEPELYRIAESLRRLEETLQPLVRDLSHSLDPATAFYADLEDAE
jgi:hypothetical protein